MNSYIIILIVLAFLAILALIFFSSYGKLKDYKEKMDKAESIIETNLNKKSDIIIKMNSIIKKVTGKKDYLKDYIDLDSLIISNIEKDWKLDEAVKLVNNIAIDYKDIINDNKYKDLKNDLRDTDEKLTSAKNMFNSNALNSNQTIKSFPNNVIAKLARFKIRSYYNTKTDEKDTF